MQPYLVPAVRPVLQTLYGAGAPWTFWLPLVGRFLIEQPERRLALLLHLRQSAARRALIRTPVKKFRSVPEAMAGEVIVLHLNYQFWFEGLPFGAAFSAPAAGSTGCRARKTRRGYQGLKLFRESWLFARAQAGSEPDVVEFPFAIV